MWGALRRKNPELIGLPSQVLWLPLTEGAPVAAASVLVAQQPVIHLRGRLVEGLETAPYPAFGHFSTLSPVVVSVGNLKPVSVLVWSRV